MKTKLIILSLISAALAGCKKDYTCECGPCYNIDGIPVKTNIHNSRDKAKQACDAMANLYKAMGDAPGCTIK